MIKEVDGNFVQQSLTEYRKGIGQLHHQLPDVADAYNAFTEACFKDGALSRKEKHLIALGLSVFTNDEYSIVYHTKGAVDQGATAREILEAACVSGAFGGGLAMSQVATLVQQTLAQIQTREINH
ncbi:MAG: carboxymuconolactone decarboxylase family protein [Thermoactinomyces sp.]